MTRKQFINKILSNKNLFFCKVNAVYSKTSIINDEHIEYLYAHVAVAERMTDKLEYRVYYNYETMGNKIDWVGPFTFEEANNYIQKNLF